MLVNRVLVCVAALASASGTMAGPPGGSDKDKLQGTWRFLTIAENGHSTGVAEDEKSAVLVVRGDSWMHRGEGGNRVEATFRLNPDTAPKSVDFRYGPTGDAFQGIYELRGDDLRLCWDVTGRRRPTEFAAKKNDSQVLWTLKRGK